jgi:large subunit ribosomal protein L2
MTAVKNQALSKEKPLKKLVKGKRRTGGRNSQGRVTTRHRGGGAKRKLRQVDLGQTKLQVSGTVETIEYDPNRTAFLALVKYTDGDRRYIIAPDGLAEGDAVKTDVATELKPGNRMQLKNIPAGIAIYNIEMVPGKGGQIVRSAGSSAQVLSFEAGFAYIRLPSSEIRRIPEEAYASIGVVSNAERSSLNIGKAGRNRHRGRRPHVRGSAMNPVDHPHGGGEGRSPIGMKYPKTPWGKPALGVKTRLKKKRSDKYIVRRRQKRRRG